MDVNTTPYLRPKSLASFLLAVGFLTSGVVSTNANLIANGSFESAAWPPGLTGVAPTSWTFPNPFAGGGIIVHPPLSGSQAPLYPSVAQDGLQYEDLPSGGVFAQAFSVGAGGSGAYQLTWYDNALIRGPQDLRYNTRYNVYVMSGPIPTVTQIINNYIPPIVATAVFDNFHGDPTDWNARSLSMTLATGDYFLLFSNANSHGAKPFGDGAAFIDDNEYMLDSVSLEVAAVPEASTFMAGALLVVPFVLQGFRRLRNWKITR